MYEIKYEIERSEFVKCINKNCGFCDIKKGCTALNLSDSLPAYSDCTTYIPEYRLKCKHCYHSRHGCDKNERYACGAFNILEANYE